MSLFSSIKLSANIPTHVQGLLESAADYSEKGQWEIALTLSIIALKELENAVGSDSHDVGLVLSTVGSINMKVNKYDEAEILWKRAVSILEKYDEESNSVDLIRLKLIKLFTENLRYEEAIVLAKQLMESYQKPHSIDSFELHRMKLLLGRLHLYLKKPDEAKNYLCAALPFYANKFDSCNTQVQEILTLLEIAYFWRNNIAESKKSLESSNEIADAIPLCSLGMLCENTKLVSKAIDYYKRAFAIYESKGFLDHLQAADISLKLGKCHLKIGNCLKSQLYLNMSRAIYKKTLADDDPVMLDIKIHLALCCVKTVKTAKFDEARNIYEEILDNVYTDGSGVSILEWARSNEKSGKDKVPILNENRDFIVPVLWDLSALYILERNYKIARILQNFAESQPDLTDNNGI